MTWVNTLHSAVDRLATLPLLRTLDMRARHRQFLANTDQNMFWDRFDSFEEAAASAPQTRHLGYDNEDSANLPYASAIGPRDYPALFWIQRSIEEGMRSFFDLGGHVGIKYYAFRRVASFTPDLRWTVCDVPAVVVRGRELARERAPEGRLQFTDRYADATGTDVLFTSGALQYLPKTLAEMISELPRKPRRLIVNTTPIHLEHSFFTLNSIGTAFCPYRVQAREPFLASLTALGYQRRDEWENVGKGMEIPGHPAHSLPSYSGFCFDLKA